MLLPIPSLTGTELDLATFKLESMPFPLKLAYTFHVSFGPRIAHTRSTRMHASAGSG